MSTELGTCPWCGEGYEFDPSLAAFSYRCPHCGDQSGIEGLRKPIRHPNSIGIHQAASQALGEHLFHFTLAIRYREDCEERIASGTLVEIHGRRFIMTAGHVLTSPSGKHVRCVAKSKDPQEPIRLNMLAIQRKEFDDVDVGFIEVADDELLRSLQATSLPLERIKDFGPGDSSRTTRVYGYPSEFVLPTGESVLKLYSMALGTMAIHTDLWPTIEWETKSPDATKDIVLGFNRDDDYWSYGPSEVRGDKPPKPHGMSGGGCWHGEMEADSKEVWSPEEVCLFGIQSQWPRAEKGGRFLRAVQVIHWLRLVADHYPDLNDELVARYPRIEEVR